MKLLKRSETITISNSPKCIVTEFPLNDSDANLAVAHITDRYPITGFVVNTESKEFVYVISGSGIVGLESGEVELSKGDSLVLDKNEKFFWKGNLEIMTICLPPWKPEQHIEFK